MDETRQLELIKEFMLKLAPEVTRHQFTQMRHHQVLLPTDEEGLPEYTHVAVINAKITLELAMHLAAQFGDCYDSLHSEAYTPPPQETAPSETGAAPPEPAPRSPAPRIRRTGEDLPT